MDSNKLNKYVAKLFGIDMILMMEDTVYMIKREKHPEEYA